MVSLIRFDNKTFNNQNTPKVTQQKKLPGAIKLPTLLNQPKQNISLADRKIVKVCEQGVYKFGLKTETAKKIQSALINARNGKNTEYEIHSLSDLLTDAAARKTMQRLQKVANDKPACQTITATLDEAALKSKLKGIKLDPKLAEIYPDDIRFLCKTRLIYSIVGYQNTTAAGPKEHALKNGVDAKGKPCLLIKKQGKWIPVKKVQEDLQWDSKEQMLASKSNSHERWNYFHEGLMPIDRFYHHEAANDPNYPEQNSRLHPVAKLSREEMHKLLAHSSAFTNFNTEKNPLKEKQPLNCIVQFVSHPRTMSESPLGKNLDAQIPVHCGIRLITSDGSVYSTGFGSTLKEDEWNEGLNHYLATINGQPTIMDYEEFRQHDGRIVTTLPINTKRAKLILDHLNSYRKNTIRFNILKQNCMRLGTNVLAMSGVHLNIRVPIGTTLYRALPDVKNIPVIGKVLSPLLNANRKITHIVGKATPECVKKSLQAVGAVVGYVPYKLVTLMKNVLMLSLGAHVSSPERNQGKLENLEDYTDDQLNGFGKLFGSLFDEHASDIEHSSTFIHWQLQQPTTFVHKYSGQPSMNLLPSEEEEAKAYNESKKAKLIDLFKYSEALPTSPKDTVVNMKAFKKAKVA